MGWTTSSDNFGNDCVQATSPRVPFGVFSSQRPGNRGSFALSVSRHPSRTTLEPNRRLGWAEITHPFHPLRGQRFAVLKTRRVAGVETLSVRGSSRGPSSVPREWTDWAEPSPYADIGLAPRVLDFACLVELADLVEALDRSRQELDK